MANEFREAALRMYLAEAARCFAAEQNVDVPALVARAMEMAAHVASEWCRPEYEPTEDEWSVVAARVKGRIESE